MSWALRLSASALAAAMLAAGTAAFVARASDHPNVEPSSAASCAGCHMSDYRGARHHVGEKPTTCGSCHAQSAWHPTHFEHPFELSGAHTKAKCVDCHRGDPPVFHGTPSDCVECHRKEYERAPDHVAKALTACQDCHSFEAWKPSTGWHDRNEKPPPIPTATTPLPVPTTTATATATATATIKKPKPRPSATASVTATPTIRPPDIVTHPSIHEHAE